MLLWQWAQVQEVLFALDEGAMHSDLPTQFLVAGADSEAGVLAPCNG